MIVGIRHGDTFADHGQDDTAAYLNPRVDTTNTDGDWGVTLEYDAIALILVLLDIGNKVLVKESACNIAAENAFDHNDGGGFFIGCTVSEQDCNQTEGAIGIQGGLKDATEICCHRTPTTTWSKEDVVNTPTSLPDRRCWTLAMARTERDSPTMVESHSIPCLTTPDGGTF